MTAPDREALRALLATAIWHGARTDRFSAWARLEARMADERVTEEQVAALQRAVDAAARIGPVMSVHVEVLCALLADRAALRAEVERLRPVAEAAHAAVAAILLDAEREEVARAALAALKAQRKRKAVPRG